MEDCVLEMMIGMTTTLEPTSTATATFEMTTTLEPTTTTFETTTTLEPTTATFEMTTTLEPTSTATAPLATGLQKPTSTGNGAATLPIGLSVPLLVCMLFV